MTEREMTKERYAQIERNGGDLTHDEQADGWHFCYGPNAGRLVNENDPECVCGLYTGGATNE